MQKEHTSSLLFSTRHCVARNSKSMDSTFNTKLVLIFLFLFSPLSESIRPCGSGCGNGILLPRSTDPTKILIQGGTVVNADRKQVADVYIEDGLIVEVKPNIEVGDNVTVVDATGKYVMPGGIDPHTHVDMEYMGSTTIDDFFSTQEAALAGGTTMHMDFVMPTNGSYIEGYEVYRRKASISCMDYGFHISITHWDDTVSNEMEVMVKENGINSIKFFLAINQIGDAKVLEGFEKCKSLGALAMIHAENGDSITAMERKLIGLNITGPEGHALARPPTNEGEAIGRAIHFAGIVNTPLYVAHVMSINGMEQVAKARQSGQLVIGQPVIAAVVLNNSGYWSTDFATAAKYVMSPPMMPEGHNKALQGALSRGVLQLLGTDHCTFNSTQKVLGRGDFRLIPGGVNGIEERMHLLWDTMVETGQITATDYVRITSTECAKIFNIYPRKGAILVGSDADVIILNPNSSFEITANTHHSRSDLNIFEGMKGKGKVEVTIAGGRIVWENDVLNVVPGAGKYVRMAPFDSVYDGIDKLDEVYRSSIQAPVQRIDPKI